MMEGRRKAADLGVALGLAILATALVLSSIGFALVAAAVALNSDLALWLSLLIVVGAILAAAAIAGLVAVKFAKKFLPLLPAEALNQAK